MPGARASGGDEGGGADALLPALGELVAALTERLEKILAAGEGAAGVPSRAVLVLGRLQLLQGVSRLLRAGRQRGHAWFW